MSDVKDDYLMGLILKREKNNTNWIVSPLRSDTTLYIYKMEDNSNCDIAVCQRSVDIFENKAFVGTQIETGDFEVYIIMKMNGY